MIEKLSDIYINNYCLKSTEMLDRVRIELLSCVRLHNAYMMANVMDYY
jgi:hypothetical protein